MNVRPIEEEVINALLDDALAAGYTVSVDNREEVVLKNSTDKAEIMKAMFSVDEEFLLFKQSGKSGWVFLVYGNDGWDVISDYTVNLEDIMAGANKVADKYC